MKLLLNLEVVNSTLTGVGFYSRQIIAGLLEAIDEKDVIFFLGPRQITRTEADQILSGVIYSRPTTSFRQSLIAKLRNSWPEILWYVSNFLFWLRSRKFQSHIYLELNNVARPFSGKTIVVCYDLSLVHYPEYHPEERRRYFSLFFEKSLRRAAKVITISRAIQDELAEKYQLKECKIAYPACPDRPLLDSEENLSLPEEYILSLGSLEPRKNLDKLLDAYMSLDCDLRTAFPLVIAGASGWNNQGLEQRIQDLVNQNEVFHLGYVPDGRMQDLYRNATLLVYLSNYEGFGMPIIEAMDAGTAVLINQEPALLEAAGDAAEAVDARSADDIAAKIRHLLESPTRRDQLVDLGKTNIKRFSWTESVAVILAELQSLG
ncbi:MAG: glycosyltransferase family 4 protein [Pseudomonadales bacterium]